MLFASCMGGGGCGTITRDSRLFLLHFAQPACVEGGVCTSRRPLFACPRPTQVDVVGNGHMEALPLEGPQLLPLATPLHDHA